MDKKTPKIIIANWNEPKDRGGERIFFGMISKFLDARVISYRDAENVLNYNLFQGDFKPFYRGFVVDEYLSQYEGLFKLDLIIKNAGVGGFVKLKTPQIILFQNPYYGYLKEEIKVGHFSTNDDLWIEFIELMRISAKQATTVAVSNYTRKEMEECDIKCDKVIEEGIDIEKFKPVKDKKELKKMHNLPLDKKIGIAVTHFTSQKGWGILTQLIHKFKDIHWIVVLTGKVGRKPKLKNVTLVEQASHNLMPRLYNCADFYINTASAESFALCPIEASACGLPIIMYKVGWAWDWWDKRLGLRVDNWDYKDFENAIKNLFSEGHMKYEPRKAIIERGFTKEVMEKNWKEFVENLLKNK